MKLLAPVLICAALILTLQSAYAQPHSDPVCIEPVTTPASKPCSTSAKSVIQGDTLFIDGEIDGMTYDLLMFDNAAAPIRHVELNSYGGDVGQGELLAQLIRSRKWTTNVREGAFCASTCILLMQAGIARTAAPGSQFGVHGIRFVGYIEKFYEACGDQGSEERCQAFTRKWYDESLEATREFFSLLENYGARPSLFTDYMKQGEDPDWYRRGNGLRVRDWVLGVEQAKQYGLLGGTLF